MSQSGQLGTSHTLLAGWMSLEGDPRLVPNGKDLRLVFLGGQTANPADSFSRGAVYTMTSGTGASWPLVNGSMAAHPTLNLGLAAASPDSQVSDQPGTGLFDSVLARAKDGSMWLAWYRRFGTKQGNSPGQQVACASRAGSGCYLAYCVPTATRGCAHVALWKVGSARPQVVPGTGTTSVRSVTLVTVLRAHSRWPGTTPRGV